MQHKVKPSAVFAKTHLRAVFFVHKNNKISILYFKVIWLVAINYFATFGGHAGYL